MKTKRAKAKISFNSREKRLKKEVVEEVKSQEDDSED